MDVVWQDGPPVTARRQIQNDISPLRRVLAGGIVSDGHGYRMLPGPGELDAQVFTDQVAEAGQRTGNPVARLVTRLGSELRWEPGEGRAMLDRAVDRLLQQGWRHASAA